MKSSMLKSIVEREALVGSSEMTQRFQHLRSFNLLPKDKGQAARDLSSNEIVNGILSIMDNRPGFAGLVVKCTKALKPVRGTEYSFKNGKSFGEALCLALEYPNDLVEIKVKGMENDDKGVPPYAYGARAQISYIKNGEEVVAFYDPRDSLSSETSQDAIDYDPRKFTATFEREYILKSDIFKKIHNNLEQEKKFKAVMECAP